MLEALVSFKTLVLSTKLYGVTFLEDCNLHIHCHEILKIKKIQHNNICFPLPYYLSGSK